MKITKTIMAAMAVSAIAITTGCKTIPSSTTISLLSYSVGSATAMAIDLAQADTKTVDEIVNIANMIGDCIVPSNSTYVATVTPKVNDYIANLQENGKINEDQAGWIKIGANVMLEGIDFMFTRHPTWKDYSDLTNVAISSFITGLTDRLPSTSRSTPTYVDLTEYDMTREYHATRRAMRRLSN